MAIDNDKQFIKEQEKKLSKCCDEIGLQMQSEMRIAFCIVCLFITVLVGLIIFILCKVL